MNNHKLSRNGEAIKQFCIIGAYLCYVLAVGFGDLMFLSLMWQVFPDGFMGYLAAAGAITTAVSACILLAGKQTWFTPGPQLVFALVFWAVEIFVLAANTVLAAAIAQGETLNGVLGAWHSMSAASPFISVIGWGLIFMLDESSKARHIAQETQANIAQSFASALDTAARSQEAQNTIALGAGEAARQFVQDVIGQQVATHKERVMDAPVVVKPSMVRVGSNGHNGANPT